MNEITPLAKRLVILGVSYVIVASALVIYFNAPMKPVLAGGILVLILALVQHFTAHRGKF